MIIGTPKEIKNHEYRIGLTPESAYQLAQAGHQVLVQAGAGNGIGMADDAYQAAGAAIVPTAEDLYARAEMIVKVKEPQREEIAMMRPGQIFFGYLHLAADDEMTDALVQSGASCIACETVTDAAGRLPLLAPMSKIAGRLAAQVAAYYLQRPHGGSGKLIGGVPGVAPAEMTVIGGGVVGRNAARIALGMGAEVTVLDRSTDAMDSIAVDFEGRVKTIYASTANVEAYVAQADALIGCVLLPGAAAPKVVSRAMIKSMSPGSVAVDVAIDQGGCLETSRPTTHAEPTYTEHGVVHYCVTNMPGTVPNTSTYALNNVTLPFIMQIAAAGLEKAMQSNPHLKAGLSIADRRLLVDLES